MINYRDYDSLYCAFTIFYFTNLLVPMDLGLGILLDDEQGFGDGKID